MRVNLTLGPIYAPLPGERPSDFFATCGRLWARFVAWRRRRQTIYALDALSDGALKDIGMHRCEIGSLAAGNDNTRIRSQMLG